MKKSIKKLHFAALVLFLSMCSVLQAQTYSVSYVNNKSEITCDNPTVTVIITTNPPFPLTFTWTSGQTGTFTGNSVTMTTPGNYTITAGVVGFPQTGTLALAILQNTVAPNIGITSSGTLLTCANSSVQLQGTSLTQSVGYLWSGSQGTIAATASLNVNANLTIPPSLAPFGNYSLTVTNMTTGCISNSVITLYQNTYPPLPGIAATFSTLTCQNNTVTLTNNSTISIPTNSVFPPATLNLNVILWQGPPPQSSATLTSVYQASVPGIYTMTVMDMNNGCTSQKTIVIGDNRIYPVILSPTNYTIACPGSVTLPTSALNNPNVTYFWTTPSGAVTTANGTGTLTTNAAGVYTVTVTDNVSTCSSNLLITVYGCVGLNEQDNLLNQVNIFPNPVNDKLLINFESSLQIKLKVVNSLGQMVYAKDNLAKDDGIDLSLLNPGVYFLKLEDGKYSRTLKIVKQ